jgi:hypothetical protein
MFHIVFDSRGAELLSSAMDMDESLDGETVLVKDDYSVGPIQNLFSEEGRQERKKWWSSIREKEKNTEADESGVESDWTVLRSIVLRMEEEEFDQIWIWMAPNPRDVCGYYWLITQLKLFSGRIYLLSLNNLPFINDKGHVFYPSSLAEIPAREFIKAKKLARPVTAAEFETDPDEWDRLSSENKNLRILEGGKKILQPADDYFDHTMIRFLPPVFQKLSRTIQQYLLKSPDKINESYLLWRLEQLVASGVAQQQGEMIRLFVKAADEVNS